MSSLASNGENLAYCNYGVFWGFCLTVPNDSHIRGLKLKVNEILFSLKIGYLFLLFSTTKSSKFLNAAVYQACKCFLRKHGPDTYTKTHIILSRSHGTKHSFCGSLPCTQKDLALVKKHCTLFNIWSLVKNSPRESHCRDQQGICYVLCILIFHKGGMKLCHGQ